MEKSRDSIGETCILMELYIEIHRCLYPLIRLVRRCRDSYVYGRSFRMKI